MLDNVVDLAVDLCRIPSLTYEEFNVLEFISRFLQEKGLIVEAIPVNENRYNIFAYKKKLLRYRVIFCTHIDTVGPHIPPQLINGNLTGRGSCDAKGIAAAMIIAVLELVAESSPDVALLFTVGEEEKSDGAKRANEVLKGRAKYVVVGEPTELKCASMQKGTVIFDLNAKGTAAHSALPQIGDSAIHKLVQTIARMLSYTWEDDTTINFGLISGGQARNMFAPQAFTCGIIRSLQPYVAIINSLTELREAEVELMVHSKSDPFQFYVPENFPSFIAAFGSDAPYLKDVGIPLLIGPGSLCVAHTEHESISCNELISSVDVYKKLALSLRD